MCLMPALTATWPLSYAVFFASPVPCESRSAEGSVSSRPLLATVGRLSCQPQTRSCCPKWMATPASRASQPTTRRNESTGWRSEEA